MTSVLRRLLPAPYVSLALFFGWLMMNQSASAGNVVLAVLLALVIPWVTDSLRPEKPRLRKLGVLARLLLVVLKDIVLSNIEVARRILGPESAIQPRFLWVPLDVRDPHAQVMLAGIITMTPGTLSSAFSDDRRFLLVHAFNVSDEQALIQDIKARYEAPLIEVFDA